MFLFHTGFTSKFDIFISITSGNSRRSFCLIDSNKRGGKTSQMLYQIAFVIQSGAMPDRPAGIRDKYTWEVQLWSFHLICEQRCGRMGNDEPRICNGGRRPNKLLLKASVWHYGGRNPSGLLSLPAHGCYSHLWNAVVFYMLCSTWNHIKLLSVVVQIFLTFAHIHMQKPASIYVKPAVCLV